MIAVLQDAMSSSLTGYQKRFGRILCFRLQGGIFVKNRPAHFHRLSLQHNAGITQRNNRESHLKLLKWNPDNSQCLLVDASSVSASKGCRLRCSRTRWPHIFTLTFGHFLTLQPDRILYYHVFLFLSDSFTAHSLLLRFSGLEFLGFLTTLSLHPLSFYSFSLFLLPFFRHHLSTFSSTFLQLMEGQGKQVIQL